MKTSVLSDVSGWALRGSNPRPLPCQGATQPFRRIGTVPSRPDSSVSPTAPVPPGPLAPPASIATGTKRAQIFGRGNAGSIPHELSTAGGGTPQVFDRRKLGRRCGRAACPPEPENGSAGTGASDGFRGSPASRQCPARFGPPGCPGWFPAAGSGKFGGSCPPPPPGQEPPTTRANHRDVTGADPGPRSPGDTGRAEHRELVRLRIHGISTGDRRACASEGRASWVGAQSPGGSR